MIIRLLFLSFLSCSCFSLGITDCLTDNFSKQSNLQIDLSKLSIIQQNALKNVLPIKETSIRIMSFNVLIDHTDHKQEEINRWEHRKSRVAKAILHINPDLIGIQELSKKQLEDLLPLLNNQYSYIGPEEESLSEHDAYDGFLFNKERIELVFYENLFTSKTPHEKSLNPFGECHIIAKGIFKQKSTQKEFMALNTHTSFYDIRSREFSAYFIKKYIKTISKDIPVMVIGDFNTFPFRRDCSNIPFYDGDLVNQLIMSARLNDASKVTLLGSYGPISSFTNDPSKPENCTPFKGTGQSGVFLDHIFVNDNVTVLNFVTDTIKVDGHFPSDHMPIITDVIIKKDESIDSYTYNDEIPF